MSKRVSLDFHDLSLGNTNMYYVEKLREQYPDFKVSMFYIPVDSNYQIMPEMQEESKKLIQKAVREGWMELIPHGLTHVFKEFEKVDAKTMELVLKAYEEHFKELELPYVKGFCPPHWIISKEAIKVLDDHGWWLAVDRNQPDMPRAKKSYEYNWDIANPFPDEARGIYEEHPADIVMGHGHISLPSRNSITETFINLTRIPAEYKWVFVSEVMNDA